MLICSCEPDDDRNITLNLVECLNKSDCYIITASDSSKNINQNNFYFFVL